MEYEHMIPKKKEYATFYELPMYDDLELIKDTFENLLEKEEECGPVNDYMTEVQSGRLNPQMRKILANWMQEVLEDRYIESGETFSLSLILLDRILSRIPITSDLLQLVGSACLLISTKMKERHHLTTQYLIESADYSFNASDLKVIKIFFWEIFIDLTLHLFRKRSD
jgi:hypothetical protein